MTSDCLLSHPYLEEVNFQVNTSFSIPICRTCSDFVPVSRFEWHAREMHRIPKPDRSRALEFLQKNYPEPSPQFQFLLTSRVLSPIQPIQGIDMQLGYRCPSCDYCHFSLTTVKVHYREHHGSVMDITFGLSLLQRISQRRFSPCFPVFSIASTNPSGHPVERIRSSLQLDPDPFSPSAFTGDVIPPEDPFVSTIGWYPVIEGKDWSALFDWFLSVQQVHANPSLHQIVLSYFTEALEILETFSHTVKSLLGSFEWFVSLIY
jgi:hypothetical protein